MNKMMSNDLILRRNVHIETWRVQATVLKAQERSDMLMVLQYVAENNSNADAKGLARELLFEENARLVVAERLLKMAEILGLIEKIPEYRHKSYILTEKGELALQEKEVFIPEDGIWEISFADDPLLPHCIVDFKPFDEPDAYKESRNKDGLEKRKQNIKPVSDWIKHTRFEAVKPFLNQKQNIWIEEIKPKGEQVKTDVKLTLEWNVSKQNVRLLKNNQVIHQFNFVDVNQYDIWQQLLEQNGWQEDWDWAENSMAMAFDETDDNNRQTMTMDLSFEQPEIDGLGQFNDFTAKNVSIHAISEQDAIEWVWWRLEHNITDFADQDSYQQWREKAKQPFSEYRFRLPARNELASIYWQDERFSKKAWYLITASDWQI